MVRAPARLQHLARRLRDAARGPGGALPGRLRTRHRATALELRPPDRREPPTYLRALGLCAVVVLGAWLGLLAAGSASVPVGPMDTRMALRPSLSGGTRINVSPLGALDLRSHTAPLRLDVDVDRLDPVRSEALVNHPERLSGLQEEVSRDVEDGTRELAVRSGAAVVLGAGVLALVVYRRPRPALAAGGLSLVLLAGSGALAATTWNPNSVLEPKYSGLLSSAPNVVGDARSIVSEFDVYQKELARLVTNVTKLYDVTSTLPAYQPDPTTLRVLHVSDIHLNPASWHIVGSLVKQYDIDVIVDSGDTMDHGSAAENGFLDPVRDLGAPYVWVRGNHDSRLTQEYLRQMKNVRILDEGRPVTVAGLRFAGIGDPQFTPDRSAGGEGDSPAALASEVTAGRQLAAALARLADDGKPVDIAVAHNPEAARQTDGHVPLVLAGHIHHNEMEVLRDGTRLRVEGSTGGSGLRAVEGTYPDPIEASILYLDRSTKRLQAWDAIKLGGLGLSTAEVSRHLPKENQPGAGLLPPTPPPSSSPSASSSPSSSSSLSTPLVPPPPPATRSGADGDPEAGPDSG
ncbi:metallophosphoesterase [Streptomyces physcomitrii]|uniref:metallophosphoesterase family protein n=1 Tax=Streptomyces physcomitrii TaxID=2724184 RepID=UPI00341A5FE7